MTKGRLQNLCEQGIQMALMAMLLIVPLVFYTKTHDVFELNKITAFRIFTLMAFMAYLTKVFLAGGDRLRPSPLWPPVILVGISSVLSTLHTNNWVTSVFGVYEDFEGLITMANYILLWFLVQQHVRSLLQVRKFLGVVVLAGSLAALYGVAQNFGFDFIMWNPATYTASRLFGSLGNPNFLAAYILMALPVGVIFFLSSRRPGVKAGLLVAVIVMAVAIFFTKSRGALYALMAELGFFTLYLWYDYYREQGSSLWTANRRWLLILGLLAGLTLFSPQVRSTISTSITRTVAILNIKEIKITPRLYIWRSALQMMRDRPILGSGLDTFQITFPKYRLAEYWRLEWNGTPEKAHNFFLQIGATTGLFGLGAWLWLIVSFYFVLWKICAVLPPLRRHLAAAMGIAQAGFLVQNQFNFTVIAYGSLFWFFLALAPTVSREETLDLSAPPAEEPISLAKLSLRNWMTYLGLAGLTFAAMVFALRLWTADVFFKRGIILMTRGQTQQALPELERAAGLNPWREIYWVKYGIAMEEAAKRAGQKEPLLKRAVEIHRHTMKMNPLNGYDYNNLGRVYKYWGDYVDPAKLAEAEAATRRASDLDPYNVYFALDLASVYLSQKRWDEAQVLVERLVGLFPDFSIPYAYQGYIALMRGNVEEAYYKFSTATAKNWRGDLNTQSSTWSNLGIVRARRGELEGAVKAFREALKLRPYYLEARLNLGLILEQQGLGRDAAIEYRHLLKRAPQYPRAEELKNKIQILERGNP